MFFDSWFDLSRVAVVGFLAYIAMILCLRISGKRTLSKWNAFDFVITIALGSTLATVLLSEDVSLAEGVVATALLIGLQFMITRLSVRFRRIERLVKAQPTLLFSKGRFLEAAMSSQRVSEAEIRAAIRGAGVAAVEEIEAVVLETDGSFSVIKRAENLSRTALDDVAD